MGALLVDGRAHASMPDAHRITKRLVELQHFAENGFDLARRRPTLRRNRLKRTDLSTSGHDNPFISKVI